MHFHALINVVTCFVLVVAGAIAGASPTPIHNHQHLHAVKRSDTFKTVDIPGPTVVAFVLNGKIVGQNEVCEGIDHGTLKWEDPSNGPSECSLSSSGNIEKPTAAPIAADVMPSQPSAAAQQEDDVNASTIQSSQAPEPSIKQASSTPSESSEASPATPNLATSSDSAPFVTSTAETSPPETSSSQASPQANSTVGGQGLDREFPDGEIDCSTFPSEYGPIEVEWANLGGWSGIQYVTVEGETVTHIVTAVPGGKGCIPGAMCSYACPAGYQKSQWPSTQGSTGQSVGGIQCNANGKLSLTNPSLSKTLCIKGTGAITVQNKLSSNAAICRTDYPGL